MTTRHDSSHIAEADLERWILSDEADPSFPSEAMAHLEDCEVCRHRMNTIAAPPAWWGKASGYLAGDTQTSMLATSALSATLQPVPEFLEAPSHPEMLGRVDHFDIEELIGQGGMGIVFRGYDRELNRSVAVKFLAPHLAANATARQRFAREARAAAAIVHANVVPIHAICGTTRPYLVMALIGGPSLETLVQQRGALDPVDVVRIGMQIAAGLDAAHRQGLVHRDIKPSNILLDGEAGRVFITDFGLARAADDVAVTQSGWLAGTPHYMSPEQTQGGELDGRSDLFSLGSVLYFLATGREPFRAPQPLAILRKIVTESPLPPARIHPPIPQPLSRLILRLLEKEPGQRFSSAEATQEILEQYLAHLQHPQTHPCPAPIRKPYFEIRHRRRFVAGIAMTLVIACIALTWGLTTWRARNAANRTPIGEIRASELAAEFPEILPWDKFLFQEQSLANQLLHLEKAAAASSDLGGADSPSIKGLEFELDAMERQQHDWGLSAR